MLRPSGEQFEIAFADQRAVLVEVGGGIRTYSTRGEDVLDGYGSEEMCTSGRGQVLIPWPNRLEDGRYELAGTPHQLPINELETRCAIHGLVSWVAWRPAEHGTDRLVLRHDLHPQPGYPFALTLRIEYALSETGLRVTTTATNVGGEPCPYGAGAHPYLRAGTTTVDSAALHLPAHSVLEADERGLPVRSIPVAGTELDFREPRAIGPTRLDHCFTELERAEDGIVRASLADPDRGRRVTLWADEGYPYVMAYTGDTRPDVARRSLAVEPMTCPPNSFRSGEGLVVLAPGDSLATSWGVSVDETPSAVPGDGVH